MMVGKYANEGDPTGHIMARPSNFGIIPAIKTHYSRCLQAPPPESWEELLLQLDSSYEERQVTSPSEH